MSIRPGGVETQRSTMDLTRQLIGTIRKDEQMRFSAFWHLPVPGMGRFRSTRLADLEWSFIAAYEQLSRRYRGIFMQVLNWTSPEPQVHRDQFLAGLELRAGIAMRLLDDRRCFSSAVWRTVRDQLISMSLDTQPMQILKHKFMLRQFAEGIRSERYRKVLLENAYQGNGRAEIDANVASDLKRSVEFLHRVVKRFGSDLPVLTDSVFSTSDRITPNHYYHWLFPERPGHSDDATIGGG